MKKPILFFSVLCIYASVNSISAQIIAEFDRANEVGCVSSLQPTYTEPNLSATELCRGAGIDMNVGNNYNSKHFDPTNGSAADAEADGEEVTFSISSDQDYEMVITQLNIRMDRSASFGGPTNFEIRANDGTSTMIISSGIVSSTGSDHYIPLATPITSTSTVSFKVLVWGATDHHGTFDVEGSTFGGTNILADPGIQIIGAVNFILPVEIISFNAKQTNDKHINLTWSTASEENNSHFEIEHSLNGHDFTFIDKVAGVGTTSEIQHYHFTHTDVAAGKNYYRLRQVDFDGVFEYSDVVQVTIQADTEIEIRPTMVSSIVQVLLQEGISTDVALQVVDITGRRIQTGSIERGAREFELQVSDLDKGVYFIQFDVAGEIITRRFIKL